MNGKSIAVVGGGASGLVSIKSCLEGGFRVTCFEMQEDLGGLWRYRETAVDGLSSVMKSTIINSSKEMSAFSDFPPPPDFPNYMHNSKMFRYLELYADHFDLRPHIRFRHEVLGVRQAEDYNATGRWLVKVKDLDSGQEREDTYDGVMVCTGHLSYTYVATFAGLDQFRGRVIHSHHYKRPAGYEDKNVVIVGIGNSAGDIAVELSAIANNVYLSTRRGTWILNRVGPSGWPMDLLMTNRLYSVVARTLSHDACSAIVEKDVNYRLNHELYKLKPQHRVLSQHNMVNDALANRIISGMVVLKNDIHHFTANGVVFAGEEDKEYECDAVVLATGYSIKFPFLSKRLINTDDNKCKLYKFVYPPHCKHNSLAFIGLIQPVGPIFPICEIQARWFVECLAGKVKLPDTQEMLLDIKRKEEILAKKYFASQRHTIEVDYIPYMDDIASKIGAKPNLTSLLLKDPKLFWACFFGPCLAYQYRLNGPHSWKGARDAILTCNQRVRAALNTRNLAGNEKNAKSRSVFNICKSLLLIAFLLSILYFMA